tara:strand:- start:268 stop:672 length:405 start_codon:yes stop_codon:yes gene_type:complete
MKKLLICILLFVISYSGYSQEFIDDSNFEDKINQNHAFTDDDVSIVIVEFWVKFNSQNAFVDWDKVKGVKYFRVDISKSPGVKKEYRIRMAPTLIVFNQGRKEEVFKAGLDLLCPVTLEELNSTIEEIKTADRF